jgi:hypothetical protein
MINKAIILGSGFSKAIISEMPLTNDLTDKIFGKIKFEKKIIHDLWDEHIVKKGIGVMLEERAGKEVKLKDFERILSYLEDAPWKDNITKHEHLILYETLTKLISDIINDITKDEDFFCDLLQENKWIRNFIKKIRDKQTAVITFNYDTIIEWLLIVYERIESSYDLMEEAKKEDLKISFRSDYYRINYFSDTYAIKNESFIHNVKYSMLKG